MRRSRLGCDRSLDRKSTRLNSSHSQSSYAVFCLKKKKHEEVRLIEEAEGDHAFGFSGGLNAREIDVRGHVLVAGTLEPDWTGPLLSFFFRYGATTKIYTLSLHDALPI